MLPTLVDFKDRAQSCPKVLSKLSQYCLKVVQSYLRVLSTFYQRSPNVVTDLYIKVVSKLSQSCICVGYAISTHPDDQLSERSHVSMTALQCSEDPEIKISLTHNTHITLGKA